MSRPHLPAWRRCRVLFALALCAWLGLVGAAWAQVDCCAAPADSALTHHDGQVPHADHGQAACACPVVPVVPEHAVEPPAAWPGVTVVLMPVRPAPEILVAPPLRPPLA